MLVAFCFLLVHLRMSPMIDQAVDTSAQAALVEVFVILFGGMLLKVRRTLRGVAWPNAARRVCAPRGGVVGSRADDATAPRA